MLVPCRIALTNGVVPYAVRRMSGTPHSLSGIINTPQNSRKVTVDYLLAGIFYGTIASSTLGTFYGALDGAIGELRYERIDPNSDPFEKKEVTGVKKLGYVALKTILGAYTGFAGGLVLFVCSPIMGISYLVQKSIPSRVQETEK